MSNIFPPEEYPTKEHRFPSTRYTGDQEENYKEGVRDAMNGRHDSSKRTGKVIHVHPSISEKPRDPSPEVVFEVLLDDAKKGNAQSQFRLGQKYADMGDVGQARFWFTKALDRWPEAANALAELEYGAIYSKLPQIAYFRVQYSDAFDRLCKAPWVLLVSCKEGGKGLRLASDIGHEYGVNIVECYKSKAEAIIAGKNMENTWGKGVKG